MKILIDTNVWIAALVAHGFCKELLDYCLGRHEVRTSEFILGEISKKLRSKFGLTQQTVRDLERFMRQNCRVLDDSRLPAPKACRDPDDDKILAAAVAIPADGILTGDADLLTLKSYAGLWISSPREFWSREGFRP